MLVQTDSRRRVTLPAAAGIKPGDALDIEILEDGRILLVPVEPVPRHQLWAWSPSVKEAVSSSLADRRPSQLVDSEDDAVKLAERWGGAD